MGFLGATAMEVPLLKIHHERDSSSLVKKKAIS
jgi:hypothetical protein